MLLLFRYSMYRNIFGAGNTVTERNAGYGAAIGIILCLCVVLVFTICNALVIDDDLSLFFAKNGTLRPVAVGFCEML